MKKFVSFVLAIAVAIAAAAQTPLDLIRENPLRAASSMHAYEPLDTAVTPAPAGYQPFYISHVGRHGSRYHAHESQVEKVEKMRRYSEAGLLTEKGEAILAELENIISLSEGKYGLLTEKGAAEHKAISGRMFRHYPEVFANAERPDVIAVATTVGRVIASRDSFCEELQKNAPSLNITKYLNKDKDKLSNAWQEVNGFPVTKEEREEISRISREKQKDLRKSLGRFNFSRLKAEWFKPTEEHISSRIFPEMYGIGKCAQCLDADIEPFERHFTPEELYHFWLSSNFNWYIGFCISIDNNGVNALKRGGGILSAIIDDADAAIAGNKVAANLRFTHDGYVLPLMAMMGIEGVSYTGSSVNCADFFQDFRNIPMAGNLQFVFYRSKKGDVIVKVLKNEKEVTVPGVKPFKGPFYKWKDLKKFFEKRLAGNI